MRFENKARHPAVAEREKRLQLRDARRHRAHFDIRDWLEGSREIFDLLIEYFLRLNWFPLEWRLRLGHKCVQRDDYRTNAPARTGHFDHPVPDALGQRDYRIQVFILLSREAYHHVQF